ncbi:MAG: radical SAM protein [Candidatus Aminicenantes bacterium]
MSKGDWDIVLIQPPIWGNYRSPWEIAYYKGYLTSVGHRVLTVDLAVDALPLISDFAVEIRKAFKNAKVIHFFLTSTAFLTSLAEFFLIRLFYQQGSEAFQRATKSLLEMHCVLRGKKLDLLVSLFLNTHFFKTFDTWLKKKCLEIITHKPQFIGCTTHTISFPIALYILKIFKILAPEVLTIISGYQATMVPEAVMAACPWVDFVVKGEGETSYQRILCGEISQKMIVSDPDKRGLNLDRLSPPDYSDLDLSKYQYISILGSRNCSHRKCIFCQENSFWNQFRWATPRKIISDIKYLLEKHQQNKFDFVELGMEKYGAELAEEIKNSALNIQWMAAMRGENGTSEVIPRLKDAGCESLIFGYETGSPRLLAMINKNITLQSLLQSLKAAKDIGLKTKLSCITGLPSENETDFLQTLQFLETHCHLIDMVSVQSFKLLVNCPIAQTLHDENSPWGVVYDPDPSLEKIEDLLFAKRYRGEPSSLVGKLRELQARRKFIELGVDINYPTSIFNRPRDKNPGFLGVR